MALEKGEIEAIAKLVAEQLKADMKAEQQKREPKCDFKWKEDGLILECETPEDRDQAREILNKGDVVIKIKPKGEAQKKGK
jgi:hypothetical protein